MVAFESLAPKVLRDAARARRWPEARIARLNSYYFALVQVIQLRGNGTCLYNGLISEFSGIGASDQKQYREFLERIGLLQVESQRQNGGRILHRYRLLRAPYQGYSPDAECREREERRHQADSNPSRVAGDSVGRDVEVDEVSASEVSTKVDTSSAAASAKTRRPSDAAFAGSWGSSIRSWNRQQILTEINEYPYRPSVEGVTHLDVLACAVELVPGAAGFIAEIGGWGSLLPELSGRLHNPDGSVREADYRYLVRAALGLERMPYATGGTASAACLISALLGDMYDQRVMEPFVARGKVLDRAEPEDEDLEELLESAPF